MKEVEDMGIKEGRFGRPAIVSALVTFGSLPVEFLHAMMRLQTPVNSSNLLISSKRMEIGVARCILLNDILHMPQKPTYILWLSDDDLPPYDGLVKLWVEMEQLNDDGTYKWDVLTSLVHLKCDPPTPVLWRHGGKPLKVNQDFQAGDIVETDVGNLGFALMRTSLFDDLTPPYFKTGFCVETLPDGRDGVTMYTEDCVFFEQLKAKKKRVGVHTGVRSAHLDVKSGVIY